MPTRKSRHIATQAGDVLILHTNSPSPTYAVGAVVLDGQQDFHGGVSVEYVVDGAAAMAKAKALVRPSRRIHLGNLDTREWTQISV